MPQRADSDSSPVLFDSEQNLEIVHPGEVMDPRVVRTRDALRRAVLEQIQRKRWEKITVQDLLDATGVSRSTFYAHFDNKLSVLTDNIPSVAGTVSIDEQTKGVDLGPLFAHVDEIAPILHPLLSQPVFREIIDEFEREFASVFASSAPESCGYLPEFLAGALISTIRLYASERNRRPPNEIASEVAAYISALLATDTKMP